MQPDLGTHLAVDLIQAPAAMHLMEGFLCFSMNADTIREISYVQIFKRREPGVVQRNGTRITARALNGKTGNSMPRMILIGLCLHISR